MSKITDEAISAEMLVHVPMCTHKKPENILILSPNEEIKKELEKYENISSTFISKDFLNRIESLKEENFDIVIVDIQDNIDAVFSAQMSRILNKNGLFVAKTRSKKEIMQNGGNLFSIVMPYRYIKNETFDEVVLFSKHYHPTADIILQRSDLLDGIDYYNTEIHLCSFALANFERKDLAGIYKQ